MYVPGRLIAALILGAGLVVGAQAAAFAQEGTVAGHQHGVKNPNRAGGQITAISGNSITVTRKSGASLEILISANTVFARNGQTASLADFQVGDFVRARGSYDGDGRFVAEALTGGEKRKGRKSAERDTDRSASGKVTAIDAAAGTLTLSRRDGATATIQTSTSTQVERNGQPATFADVKVGDKVRAEGARDSNGHFVADRLVSSEKGEKGATRERLVRRP